MTADDFGLHLAVNEAVEAAARRGVLTCASLMMGAPATADAIERARRTPQLRIGLHIMLADGWASARPELIPGIAHADGRISAPMLAKSLFFFFTRSGRRQLAVEIRAQFEAYARTGLALDHVNVHKHFHLHPTILSTLLRIAREFGMPPVRLPREPWWMAARHGVLAAVSAACLAPWVWLLRRKLRRAGAACNDAAFGLAGSGAMDEAALLWLLARLPAGVSEIYLHPASESGGAITASMPDYRHTDELDALLSPTVRAAIVAADVEVGGFRDLFAPGAIARA